VSKSIQHLLVGIILFLVISGVYADKIYGEGYIFTEVIQDITNIYGFYPWDSFSAQELAWGYFPLWNSHNGLGVPHLANMQSAVFYPLSWIKFLLGFWRTIDWLLILRLWLAGFFLYLFVCSSLGLPVLAGLVSGLCFFLCGYFLKYVYMSHLNVECLLPLQLYLFFKLNQKRTLPRWSLSVLGIYLLITGGFPEASLYALGFSSLYFLVFSPLKLKSRFLLLFTILFAGVLLSSVQWLVFYEYLPRAWTYHHPGVGTNHLDIAYIISLLLPWFFGKNLESPLVPFLVSGIGTAGLILVFYALSGLRRNFSQSGFWALSSLFLLGVVYGVPPFSWLGYIYPFSITYNYKYSLPALALCLSVLSGVGFKSFLEEKRILSLLFILGGVWLWAGINLAIALLNGFKPFYAFGANLEMFRLTGIIIIFFIALFFKDRFSREKIGVVLILFALIVNFYLDRSWGRGRDESNYLFSQLNEARYLTGKFRELARFSGEGKIFFPNLLLSLGIDDLRIYEPIYPRGYVYLLSAIEGLESDEEINQHYKKHILFQVSRERISSGLFPLLNVGIFAVERELNSQPVAETILERGQFLGRFSSWSRIEVVNISGESKKSLLLHSPVLVKALLKPGFKNPELKFEIGIAPSPQGEFAFDGGEFLVFSRAQGTYQLLFYRYLNPAEREERSWKEVKIPLKQISFPLDFYFAGLPGVKGDFTNDYFAWAGLRFYYPELEIPFAQDLTKGKGEISLNQLENNFPRYFLIESTGFLPVRNLKEALKFFLKFNRFKPDYFRTQAIVFKKMELTGSKSGQTFSQPSYVRILKRSSQEVELEYLAPNDCFLLASEQYYPGWRAFVDGKETRIYRADLSLRLIFTPAGKHKVHFIYQPVSFALGLFITIAGVLFFIIMNLAGLFRFKKW